MSEIINYVGGAADPDNLGSVGGNQSCFHLSSSSSSFESFLETGINLNSIRNFLETGIIFISIYETGSNLISTREFLEMGIILIVLVTSSKRRYLTLLD